MTRMAVKSPHGLSCVDKGLMVRCEWAMHFLARDSGIPIGVCRARRQEYAKEFFIEWQTSLHNSNLLLTSQGLNSHAKPVYSGPS
jgi:hypothetical protein